MHRSLILPLFILAPRRLGGRLREISREQMEANARMIAMMNETLIVSAHRLSTILAADQILVMNRGRIVKCGMHAERLNAGGLYAQLYHTQFNREK